jgi:hypothetical protein
MSIWNTGASPIGYAYQSNKGSGINIKPIDPRAFMVDTGSATRSNRSGGDDSDGKYNAQIGTRSRLEDLDIMIANQKSSIQKSYTEKILNEKDESKILALQKEYVEQVNFLTRQKMQVSVGKQSA